MKSIAIVGFGRFGKLLAEYAHNRYKVKVIEPDKDKHQSILNAGYQLIDFKQLNSIDYIFIAVPISKFEDTVLQLAPAVQPNQVVIDLCSVKVYPAKVMQEHLKNCQLLATHPMFGPDSAKLGLQGLKVAFCPISIDDSNQKEIKNFWEENGATVALTTPEEHDQDTVYSQAFTYIMARMINTMHLPDITFDTRSYKDIVEVARLSAKDSSQLFHDMLYYNPYLKPMLKKLETATNNVLKEAHTICDELSSK